MGKWIRQLTVVNVVVIATSLATAVAGPIRYVHPSDISQDTILSFDDISDYAFLGTPAYDSEHWYYSSGMKNRSIKVTFAGIASYVLKDYGAPKDFAGKNVLLRFYVNPGSGTANPDSSETGLSYANIKLYNTYGENYQYIRAYRYKALKSVDGTLAGWYEIAIPTCNFHKHGTGADLSKIRYVKAEFVAKSASSTCSVTFDRFFAYNSPLKQGCYTIRIDASHIGALDIAKYAAEKGISLSIGISPPRIGKENNLTVEQLKDIQRMGHELTLYTGYTSGSSAWSGWYDKTQAQKEAVIREGQEWFEANGLDPDGAKIAFLSGGPGWIPLDDEQFIKSKKLIAHAGNGPWAGYGKVLASYYDTSRWDWTLFINKPDSGSIPADLPALITEAEKHNLCLVLGAHCHTDNEKASLKASIDALIASNLTNFTVGDLARGRATMPVVISDLHQKDFSEFDVIAPATEQVISTYPFGGGSNGTIVSQAFALRNGKYLYLYQVDNDGPLPIEVLGISPFYAPDDLGIIIGEVPMGFLADGLLPGCISYDSELNNPLLAYQYPTDAGADIPAGEHSAILYVISPNAPSDGDAFLIDQGPDTVDAIVAVPEPSMVILLITGGLVLLRLNKKQM